MELSVHDNLLLSYCALVHQNEIHLHTVYPDQDPPEMTDVVFAGGASYHFERDNFQTIVFDIEEMNVEVIYADDRKLFEEGRQHCWPGAWNTSDKAVITYLLENEIKGYYLSSSLGMVGWVLAKSMTLFRKTA
jgi:hypothetical protein